MLLYKDTVLCERECSMERIAIIEKALKNQEGERKNKLKRELFSLVVTQAATESASTSHDAQRKIEESYSSGVPVEPHHQ